MFFGERQVTGFHPLDFAFVRQIFQTTGDYSAPAGLSLTRQLIGEVYQMFRQAHRHLCKGILPGGGLILWPNVSRH